MNRSKYKRDNEKSVSTIMEYMMISGIIMALIIVLMLTMNFLFLDQPREKVSYHAFVDIGNGVSTRIVDLYTIAPNVQVNKSTVRTKYYIPEQVARSGYFVDIYPALPGKPGSEELVVSRGSVKSVISLAGIGSSPQGNASGSTTGMGEKIICYDSTGHGECPP